MSPRAPSLTLWLLMSLAAHLALVIAAPIEMPRAGESKPMQMILASARPDPEPAPAEPPRLVSAPVPARARAAAAPARISAPARAPEESHPKPEQPPAPAEPGAESQEPAPPEGREAPAEADLGEAIFGLRAAPAGGWARLWVGGGDGAAGAGGGGEGRPTGHGGEAAGEGEPGPAVAPVADSLARPAYPEEARRRGIGGTVVLRVLVSTEGRVDEVAVARSSGDASLDRAAEQAARGWRFRPARRAEKVIAAWVVMPVEFHIED